MDADMPREVLYVLIILGQRLCSLGSINYTALPKAEAAVREALSVGDRSQTFVREVDHLKPEHQSAVACAITFCSECWPIGIWRGFGKGVLPKWQVDNADIKTVDTSIAALKGKPRDWNLFTKSPSRIGRTPALSWNEISSADQKELKSFWKQVVKDYEKRGFPQPEANVFSRPLAHVQHAQPTVIRTWSIPYALSGTNNLYKTIGHDYETACTGMCCGRMLYAWTAGKCADLQPGEGLLLMDAHVRALAKWLEGLEGVTFKVLLDTELEPRAIKFRSSTRKWNCNLSGNDQGICNVPYVMIRREPSKTPSMSQITKTTAALGYPAEKTKNPLLNPTGLPPAYSPTVSSTTGSPQDNGTHNDDHRPAPLPPATTKWPMMAIHDFKPVSENELGFKAGQYIDLLQDPDMARGGWCRAVFMGKEGLVPRTFVVPRHADYDRKW